MEFFFVLFVIGLVVWAVYILSVMSGSKEGKLSNVPCTYIDGIPNLSPGIQVLLEFTPEKISIDNKHFIPIDRIKGFSFNTSKQLTQQQKSIIGRALAGGVILGPLGAILGGLSGVGSKERTQTVHLITVFYKSKSGEDGVALFSLHPAYYMPHIENVICTLNNRIGFQLQDNTADYEI